MDNKKILRPLQLFFILVLCNFTLADGLSQNREIQWKETLIKDKIYYQKDSAEILYYLGFENAAYLNPDNHLPYYTERITLQKNERISSVSIQEMRWEKIDWEQLNYIRDLKNIPETLEVDYAYEEGRGEKSATIEFIPLRKNSETGRIEKLSRFTMNVSKTTMPNIQLKSTTATLKNNSVLAGGSWLRFKVYQDGLYKITYEDLINQGVEDVSQVQIFGNGGGQLTYDVGVKRIDDLVEIPLRQRFGSDGEFGPGDYFYFFVYGPNQWEFDDRRYVFNHDVHDYSGYSAYFLTWGQNQPRTVESAISPGEPAEETIHTFIDYGFHEAELENPLKSGRQWLGERFDGNAAWDTTFVFKNIDASQKAHVAASVVGRDDAPSSFQVFHNEGMIQSVSMDPVNLGSHVYYWADDGLIRNHFDPSGEDLKMSVKYLRQSSNAQGWLDYITVNAYRHLKKVPGESLYFRNIYSTGNGSVLAYEIENTSSEHLIWDITNIHQVKQLQANLSNGTTTFKAEADTIRYYVVFSEDEVMLSPEFDEILTPNQNLHATPPVDYVIIAYSDFLEQANELAQLHREESGLEVLVVTPQKLRVPRRPA